MKFTELLNQFVLAFSALEHNLALLKSGKL